MVTLGPGSFTGELAHLSGRPGLVDVRASSAVEALLIRPDRLRALLIAEAECKLPCSRSSSCSVYWQCGDFILPPAQVLDLAAPLVEAIC